MTPEERAELRIHSYNINFPYLLKAEIAADIRAAVMEEREACRKIAVSYAQAYMSEHTHGDGRQCGESIADAIRAREKP